MRIKRLNARYLVVTGVLSLRDQMNSPCSCAGQKLDCGSALGPFYILSQFMLVSLTRLPVMPNPGAY